ncbi:MAG: two-component regulator propeller domain-containing protein [bacterium]
MNYNFKLLFKIMFICLGTLLDAYGQEKNITFENLGIKDGLSQSSIYCILQDCRGFIWFGTEDGLNKYDGYTFYIYRNNPQDPYSISYNYIRAICEDCVNDKNILWIGTYGGGLNKFDTEIEKFFNYRNDPRNNNTISNNFIKALCKDEEGFIWIGTEQGLNRFNPRTEKFITFYNKPDKPQSLSDDNINVVYADSFGILWVGTQRGGLNKIKFTGKNQDSIDIIRYQHNEQDNWSISSNCVTSIYEDYSGRLWIGTDNGALHRFDREQQKFERYTYHKEGSANTGNDDITAVREYDQGMLWVGTKGDGMYIFNPHSEKFISYHNIYNPRSLSNDEIYSIYQDRSNILWIGTDVGLNKYNQEQKQFLSYQLNSHSANSLNNNIVYSIIEDQAGIIWIGTYGGGLNRFDPVKNQFSFFKHDPQDFKSISNNRVRAVHEDRSGRLWIGTYGGGLNRFDRKNKDFFHYQHNSSEQKSISSNFVRTVCEDQYGFLWIGTEKGLNRFNLNQTEFTVFRNQAQDTSSLSSDFIYSLYEDSYGTLWIGTLKGLNKFNHESKNFTRYLTDPDNPSSLSNNEVLCMYEDSARRFWIGTPSGLNLLDREKETFTYYLIKDGLPNNLIYSILEDSLGRLWLSTNKGLSCFDPETETFRNYDVEDGLQSNEFNIGASCRTRNGEMYFGGINGFNRFFPDKIKDNPFVPPVVFTDFLINNKSVPIGEEVRGRIILDKSITETSNIKLLHKDKVISFKFAALHYAAPEKNCYKYKMVNFDDNWNETGTRRFVTYTNLKPGKYIFRVKGSNADGVWNPEEASVKIQIIPPFWQTKIFQILILIFIGMTVFVTFRIRTYQIRRKNIQLEEQVKKRTWELKKINKDLKQEITERKKIQIEREKLIQELTSALDNVKTLKGMLPICARCKKVKDDQGYWQQVDEYVRDHSETEFSHGLCPECMKKLYPDYDVDDDTDDEDVEK